METFWRTLGSTGSNSLETEPHPESTAFPTRTSFCFGNLTAATLSLKTRGVLSFRTAMSYGATPLKKKQYSSIQNTTFQTHRYIISKTRMPITKNLSKRVMIL